ncbi:MAG: ATP-binding protein [Acutalibacteraceae bacterium]
MINEKYTAEDSSYEHILVCLSASPSNARIVRSAAKMASAFGGLFTALYVETPASEHMSENDKKRLNENIALAEKLGADIATVYGDDISFQIAEFARISAVTKVVIGRSVNARRRFWNKPTLTERLAEIAPNLDIHIIPDALTQINYGDKKKSFARQLIPSIKDLLITAGILTAATLIGNLFFMLGITEANIITIYIFGVLLISVLTKGYICGILGSVLSVTLFNFFMTEPRLTFHAYDSGYTVTFAIMLVTSIVSGTLASRLKNHAKLSAQTAFRTKVLFDTNKLLQKVHNDNDIINITASQLSILLNRNIIAYPEIGGKLSEGLVFSSLTEPQDDVFFSETETQAAQWVLENKRRAGVTTEIFPETKCLYLAICTKDKAYGVVGIHINGVPLEAFENSVLLSILGECALAIENSRIAKEKETADLMAKNEQLRANLLRSISHDLRTPLTSISGNASNLRSNYDKLDDDTRMQMFTDIYDDSQWLISLVEKLLSVTRIEEGRMNFALSIQLIDEVIEEALKHINRKSSEHNISVEYKSDLLLAKIDARLIIQVIINIVDNAIKYTPKGSEIKITAQKKEDKIFISISDDGDGIPDDVKPKVFEMFYTCGKSIADSRRGLGLGLALCKSIMHAHGGEIYLSDNSPHGCIFTLTLPSEEVTINE